MESFILAWVLVISTPHSYPAPYISEPFADLDSCNRVMRSIRRDVSLATQCVQVRVPVIKVPKVQEECKVEE